MSYNLKITVHNNRDYAQDFILKDDSGDPINLTGCKLIFGYGTESKTIGTHTSDTAPNKCIFITSATDGEFTLELPFNVLKTLNPATYFHDLILVDTNDNRQGIWQGQMIVKRGVA
jgi:hypothetical protein